MSIFKKNGLLFIMLVGIILSITGSVMACGTVDDWISVYERGQRHKALFHMIDCASSYVAPDDDIALLPVIADALTRNAKIADMAVQVFHVYNCLYGARNQKGYRRVLKTISSRGEPVSLDKFHDWLVVTAQSGANLRNKPSLDGRVLTAVQYGMQVRRMGEKNEWVKVDPVGPGSIDPRYDRVTGYIHKSLLVPY